MVIMFRGTSKSKNYAPQALAMCAGLGAIRYNRKTLVLQLTDKFPVEKIFVGKRLNDVEMQSRRRQFKDAGIDSLLRRVGKMKLDAMQFHAASIPILPGENMLDVVATSDKEKELEADLLERPDDIKAILEAAQADNLYEDVYIFANGKNTELIKILNGVADISVVCIPQGIKEPVEEPGNHVEYLITEYDSASQHDMKYMSKLYGVKKMSVMPYCISYKDAFDAENALKFIYSCDNVQTTSSIYSFVSHMDQFLNKITGNLEETEEIPIHKKLATVDQPAEQIPMYAGDVSISNDTRMFHKKDKVVHIVRPEDNQVPISTVKTHKKDKKSAGFFGKNKSVNHKKDDQLAIDNDDEDAGDAAIEDKVVNGAEEGVTQ